MYRRTSDRWLAWALGAIVLGLIVLIVAGASALAALGCYVDWRDSGRDYRFQWLSGTCQVHDDKGWVPASRVRVD